MPLYEYQCDHCGRFELIRKFSDPVVTACPTCGREVQKLASAPAVHFKGTGWYVTDYASKGKDKGKESEAPKAASGDGGSKGGEAAKSAGGDGKASGSSTPKATTSDKGSASGSSSSQ